MLCCRTQVYLIDLGTDVNTLIHLMQVRGHAVEVLQRTEDEELLYYLLQLVQALRYESTTHSRLSTFLVARATNNTVMATLLHWYAGTICLACAFTDCAYCDVLCEACFARVCFAWRFTAQHALLSMIQAWLLPMLHGCWPSTVSHFIA